MKNEKINHRVPLGYKIDKIQVLKHDKNANKVRRIFDVYLKKKEIRKTADAVGLRVSTVSYILRNEFYYSSEKPLIDKRTFKKVQKILNSIVPNRTGNRYPKSLKKEMLEKIAAGKTIKQAREEVGLKSKSPYSGKIPYKTIWKWKNKVKI